MNHKRTNGSSLHVDSRGPLTRVGVVMLVAVTLVASSALAGVASLPGTDSFGPVSAEVPGDAWAAGDDLESAPSVTTSGALAPWWVEWLAGFDLTGSGVEDHVEELARVHMESGRPEEPVSVLVTYEDHPGPEDITRLVDGFGADAGSLHVLSSVPTLHVTVPAHRVQDLGILPGVVAVEWDYPVVPLLATSAPSTQAREFLGGGSNAVYNGMTAEALGYMGEGSIVAVIDTGVQPTHPAFAGRLVATADSSTVLTVECTVSHDVDGHGTHVASTAIGNPATDSRRGTAMDAGLVDIQISKQIVTIGGIQRALDWVFQYNRAIEQGNPKCGVGLDDRIDVATVSFGSSDRGGPNAGSTEGLVDRLVSQGVVVTIAVGNCGPQPSLLCDFGDIENGISSPGNAHNAIGVAAVNHRGTVDRSDDVIAGFSSRGPNSAVCCTGNTNPGSAGGATGADNLQDRFRKPDVAGPGVGISAANAFHTTGPDYVSMSGTSMSTPHVAGIAALLIQAGEEVKGDTGGENLMRPTGSSFSGGDYVPGKNPVRDAIMFSADYNNAGVPLSMLNKWEGPNSVNVTWNNAYGYGQADAFAALCWAWVNVLVPGGASMPLVVDEKCDPPALSADAGGPYQGVAGEPISFSGNAEGGFPPYQFSWTLGDGSTRTGAQITYAYQEAGNYTVQLTVTDGQGTIVTVTTTADVEPGPGPFVQITEPGDGETVEGPTTIRGVAGNTADEAGEAGSSSTSMDAGMMSVPEPEGGLSLQRGTDVTLYFHGEDVDGVGMPNAAGVHGARLLPELPHGEQPVVHTGTTGGFGVPASPVVLMSPALANETRLGDGDPSTTDHVTARVHVGAWTTPTGGTFDAELNAVKDGASVLPLARGSASIGLGGGMAELEIPMVLGEGISGAPVDEHGDLIVPAGYRLEFVFNAILVAGALYSVFYDSAEFNSRVEFPVSPRFGDGPEFLSFNADPISGDAPLSVTFSGTVQAGTDPVDFVELDPGDGSEPMKTNLTNGEFMLPHTYDVPGTWVATAVATDQAGRQAMGTVNVEAFPAPAVFVTIGEGPTEKTEDSSEGGDWSSWQLVHDFSVYEPGTNLTVTAVYFDGETESPSHTITVIVGETEPLEAVIEGPDRVRRGETATFDGTESRGPVESWHWDFGDGSQAEGPLVEHTWSRPGNYTVTLRVQDVHGNEAIATHAVRVVGGPPS